jgi:hypothetical protein
MGAAANHDEREAAPDLIAVDPNLARAEQILIAET